MLVEHGKPLLFGKEGNRGLRLKPGSLQIEAVVVGENGVTADDILVHDERDRMLAHLLVAMEPPALPVALGVIHCHPDTTYEDRVHKQISDLGAPTGDLNALLRKGRTWEVDSRAARLHMQMVDAYPVGHDVCERYYQMFVRDSQG